MHPLLQNESQSSDSFLKSRVRVTAIQLSFDHESFTSVRFERARNWSKAPLRLHIWPSNWLFNAVTFIWLVSLKERTPFVHLFFSNKKILYILGLLLQVAFKWATSFLFASECWSKGVFSPITDKRHIRVPYLSNEQNLSISQKFKLKLKPRLYEQFLCGNCIWQFLFARVDDRQIFVIKLPQAMLDGQNIGTLGTGFYTCRWKNCHILCGVSFTRTIILCGNFYLPHKNQRASFSANAVVT